MFTKSHLTAFLQCPKRLWLMLHQPESALASDVPSYSYSSRLELKKMLTQLYPQAHQVSGKDSYQQTQALMNSGAESILGATFVWQDIHIRVDLLVRNSSGYRVIDHVAATSIKEHALFDFSLKVAILKRLALSNLSFELAYLNKRFVYLGDGNYQQLFCFEKVEPLLLGRIAYINQQLESMLRCAEQESMPNIHTGRQCTLPIACPFQSQCGVLKQHDAPILYPLDALHRMSAIQKDKLRAKGYRDLRDVPETELSPTQLWIQRVSRSGQAELLPEAASILAKLPYPRYYFDFETITFVVPPWHEMRPLSGHIPYQWSCHIEDQQGQLSHVEFLDVSGQDPRRACAELMLNSLGNTGPIFVYSQVFEKARIEELAVYCPDLAKPLRAINARIIDLLPLTRSSYYHPAMLGSWSIKSVLPTIAPELDYALLDIGNGGDAQQAYHEIIDPETTTTRKQQLIVGLKTYCQRDTLALVRLAHFLMSTEPRETHHVGNSPINH